MKPEKIKDVCLQNKGTVYDFKDEWNAERALVGGKMYMMMGTNKEGNSIVTVKAESSEGARYREMYPGVITEGYYMNKVHWISIRMDKDVDEPLIETLINESYELIFKSLTKKIQSEIK